MSIGSVSSASSNPYTETVSPADVMGANAATDASLAQMIDALTPSDKEFLHDTYGLNFTVASNGGRPVGLNIVGMQMALDRLAGRLPAGTSIGADYLKSILATYRNQETDQRYGLLYEAELGLTQLGSRS